MIRIGQSNESENMDFVEIQMIPHGKAMPAFRSTEPATWRNPMRSNGHKFLGAALVAGVIAALAGPAAAQNKSWRHAIIAAKSDAGLFFMPVKGGFAQKLGLNVELLQIKTDDVGLKALIAGEVDSFEGGPQGAMAAAARGADVKVLGCHWVVVPHGVFVRN